MKLDSSPLQHRRSLWPWFVLVTVLFILLVPVLPLSYRSSEVTSIFTTINERSNDRPAYLTFWEVAERLCDGSLLNFVWVYRGWRRRIGGAPKAPIIPAQPNGLGNRTDRIPTARQPRPPTARVWWSGTARPASFATTSAAKNFGKRTSVQCAMNGATAPPRSSIVGRSS